MKERIVILGAGSFAGQDLVSFLADRNYEVLAFLRERKNKVFCSFEGKDNVITFLKADINTEFNRIICLLDKLQVGKIISFISASEVAPSWQYPAEYFQTNCVSHVRLIDYLKNQSWLEKFIYISSPELYGTTNSYINEDEGRMNASTPYALSKGVAQEINKLYFKEYSFPVINILPTNYLGRMQLWKIAPKTIIAILKGESIKLNGGGEAIKSFIDIKDVSNGIFTILNKGKIGEDYHISPEQGIAVKDLIYKICNLMNANFDEIVEVVAPRKGEDKAYTLNCSKLKNLGWKAEIPIEETLKDIINWIKDNWNIIKNIKTDYEFKN